MITPQVIINICLTDTKVTENKKYTLSTSKHGSFVSKIGLFAEHSSLGGVLNFDSS